jgi:hypothetical protein
MAENKKETTSEKTEEKYPIPYTHKLKYPVEWGKQSKTIVDEIVFSRRLKVSDLKGLPASNLEVNDMIRLIARCTGNVTALIEELDAEDYIEVVQVVQYFLNGGQTSGEE